VLATADLSVLDTDECVPVLIGAIPKICTDMISARGYIRRNRSVSSTTISRLTTYTRVSRTPVK